MKKRTANTPNETKIAKLVRELLVELGEDPGLQALFLFDVPQLQQRRFPDELIGGREDVGHVVDLLTRV